MVLLKDELEDRNAVQESNERYGELIDASKLNDSIFWRITEYDNQKGMRMSFINSEDGIISSRHFHQEDAEYFMGGLA